MIREILERKIDVNFDLIVNEFVNYFGEKYKEKIENESKKIKVSVVKSEGVYYCDESEVYVGEEPVCIKEKEGTHIVLPLSVVYSKFGNVIFAHVMVHALTEDVFVKDNSSAFNEIVVDYIANDISKSFERKKINVTVVDCPIYESNSFYSNMFDEIGEFFDLNKGKILSAMMGEKVIFYDEVDEYIEGAQNVVDRMFVENSEKPDFTIKRR